MPVFLLSDDPVFPPACLARPDGLLAVGGDLSQERLLAAYRLGIFPWYSHQTPILWWTPDPRLVLFPGELHVSRRLRKTIRRGTFQITADTAFHRVIRACANARRPDDAGTWLVEEMIQAYCRLHASGMAHSVEAWQEERLVGGLYGVALGRIFFGESMFSLVSDASKVALVTLARGLGRHGFHLIDCQVHTEHLIRFGARELPRSEFLERLSAGLDEPAFRESWNTVLVGTRQDG